MRDVVEFETGPDGELILALDTAGSECEDLTVELSSRTVHIASRAGRGWSE